MPDIAFLQRMLAKKALLQPNHRFHDLYDLVRDAEWLRVSLEAILSNKGALTPGVDGVGKAQLESEASRAKLVEQVARELRERTYQPQPVRRVYIPKASGKLRPLGIPTITDRMVQECLRMVLEPIYESIFLPCSYGFRPGRGTMDAIRQLDSLANAGHRYYWIVEGDIEGCFDNIPHKKLLALLGEHVADHKLIHLVQCMLAAGYVEDGRIYTPNCGTPQGGVVSPLLANIHLHQMDRYWHEKYRSGSAWSRYKIRRVKGRGNVQLIRYADDFLILTNGNQEHALELKDEFRQVLEELGLRLSTEKTLVTHVNDGINFLGFHAQRLPLPQQKGRYVMRFTPTERNVQRFKDNIRKILSTHTEDPANKIRALNDQLRGWATYYRHVASYDVRASLDHWVSKRLMLWLHRKHGNKLNNNELYGIYKRRDRKGWQSWQCEGISLMYMKRDIRWRVYLMRTHPHPYLEPSISLVVEDTVPVSNDVWRGTSSQNRYALARLRRMKAVNYTCEGCHKGPLSITELHAHHPRGKAAKELWDEIEILCLECHQATPSYGVKRAFQST